VETTPPRSFGELLRRYRIAAGLTQEALAERAQMSLAAIGKLERGARQKPYRATIELLAEALSLPAEDRLVLERAAGRAAPNLNQGSETRVYLPVHFSSFVGRERDLANVGKLLANHRLLTLVGAGGVGKTRLAIRAVEDFITENPSGERFDGIWFIDLSSLTDEAMLAMALGSIIGLNQCRTIDILVNYLRSQSFVLILDNCEHLLDSVAQAAKAIITGCPQGRILATSRQALSIEGERVYRLPPLSLPPPGTLSADAALQFDAVRLFKDRAEATDNRFELTDAVVPAVIEICRRLDGIALAIELAAARINAFSPANIAGQIEQHFLLLTGGDRTSLPRHKTMHALFDWSYDLLDERERELFRRSSIFANGFTLELLVALYAGGNATNVPSLLASLVDKSFVQCDILTGPRYRLLEPARQYAREKLTAEEYARFAKSHALALLALAEDFDSRLEVIPDRIWTDYIERERENFRAVFDWAFGPHGDTALGRRLAASKSATWSAFATGEVRTWIEIALETCDETTPPHVRATLALNAARAAVMYGTSWRPDNDPEAGIEASRHALALAEPSDLRAVATAEFWLGVAIRDLGRFDEAEPVLRAARAKARSAGAQTEYNAATTALGVNRYGAGDLEEAHALVSEALKLSEDAGSDRTAADARAALAEIAFSAGRAEEALALNEKTLEFFRTHANLLGVPLMLCNSATYLIVLGRFAEARDYAAEALRRARSIGITHGGLWAMQHLAAAAIFDENAGDRASLLRRAASVLGFVDEATTRRGMPRYSSEQQEYDEMLLVLRATFDEGELATIISTGKMWSEEQAMVEVQAL
jgi:predicted ATPase/DNA-binding XRE family transcriptional regulator